MTTLQAGQKQKLSDLGLDPTRPLTVTVQHGMNGLDVSAFGLDENRKMLGDDYIAFYNNPRTPLGEVGVQLQEGQQATFTLDLSKAARMQRVMITATHDSLPLAQAPTLRVQVGDVTFDARAALGQEKAAMLLEIYQHGGEWRLGAVGQGFNGGLGELVKYFGGEVEAAPPSASTTPTSSPTPTSGPAPTPAPTMPTVSLTKTVNLNKGSSVSLRKADGAPELRQVVMGLGWDPVGAAPHPSGKGGFLGNLMNRASALAFEGGGDIDLDASCLLFDAQGNVADAVWFVQKRSRDGSIVHSGDNLTGAGEGDDETIRVDLQAIPAQVQHLVFTVNSFRGQQFTQVSRAYCRLLDGATGRELARYDLTGGAPVTGMLMVRLSRVGDGWHMTALGEQAGGRTVQDLQGVARQFLG